MDPDRWLPAGASVLYFGAYGFGSFVLTFLAACRILFPDGSLNLGIASLGAA